MDDIAALKEIAVEEAVRRLGLVKPEAAGTILSLLQNELIIHPRSIAASYRKGGMQLSKEEKRALGLRANAFLNREAYAELTEMGLAEPLTAHEKTLLRATFTIARHHSVERTRALMLQIDNSVVLKYDTNNKECPFCGPFDKSRVTLEDFAILPPSDCICETPSYTLSARVDWFSGQIDKPNVAA